MKSFGLFTLNALIKSLLFIWFIFGSTVFSAVHQHLRLSLVAVSEGTVLWIALCRFLIAVASRCGAQAGRVRGLQ